MQGRLGNRGEKKVKQQWTIAASFLTPLVSSSPTSSIFIHHHLSIGGRRLMSLNTAGSAGLAHAEKMGSVNFDRTWIQSTTPNQNTFTQSQMKFAATVVFQPSVSALFFLDTHSINPRVLLAKHPIFSPAVEHSGRCHTDTSIVFKVVWFNGESCTIAPLT